MRGAEFDGAGDSDGGGFGSEAVDFTGEELVGGGALFEPAGGGLEFQAFEVRGQGVGSDVGASALAVVGEAHGALRIVVADSLVEQDHLAGSVVYQ